MICNARFVCRNTKVQIKDVIIRNPRAGITSAVVRNRFDNGGRAIVVAKRSSAYGFHSSEYDTIADSDQIMRQRNVYYSGIKARNDGRNKSWARVPRDRFAERVNVCPVGTLQMNGGSGRGNNDRLGVGLVAAVRAAV